jgi:TolB-like protein/Tfp pilus assembly protein PilF
VAAARDDEIPAARAESMSLFAELKRRNVYRAAAFYAAAGWLLVQIATQVFPFFDIPNWSVRLVVIAVIVGFPFAMLFSWFYELTPQGIKLESEVDHSASIVRETGKKLDRWIIAILSLTVVLLLANAFVLHKEAIPVVVVPATATVAIPAKSIAVLPFTDLSPAHDQEYFSDGMAEEILNALARVKALKVVARGSSFQFKGKSASPNQIGAELGVAHILEGSVRKQGEQLRITATLMQTSDGVQQWSKTYDGKLADVFDLQESCARDIATELKVVLGGENEQRLVDKTTVNVDAYALFVEAQTLVNHRVGDSLPQAIALLQKATALDPKFARAWSKLAVAYAVLAQYVGGDWEANWKASDQAARYALTIDPTNAEAYAALSYNLFSQRRYVDMAEPMHRALELGPDDLAANYWAANELAAMGRTAEAEAVLDVALINDPANTLLLFYKGALRWRAGDVAATVALARRTQDRGAAFAALLFAWYDATVGDFDAGATQFAIAEPGLGSKLSPASLEAIYRGTFQGEALRHAALSIMDAHPDDDWTPTFLLQLGEPERAFVAYEHGKTGLSDGYLNWLWQPEAWSLKARQSAAFQGFAKRIGLLDYWRKNRWPDLCSPTPEKGPDAFTCR